MKVENVIGWRLDLLRNCAEWQSSQVVVAKAEFIELITKTELFVIPVSVYLYLDRQTSKKYYEHWLEESGLSLNELISCSIIELEHADFGSEKEYLRQWYKSCSQFISAQTKHLNTTQDENPAWFTQHQQTQYDSILPIYF